MPAIVVGAGRVVAVAHCGYQKGRRIPAVVTNATGVMRWVGGCEAAQGRLSYLPKANMTGKPRGPEYYLPLTPMAFEILLAVAEGERHGYDVMLAIERRTGGQLSPIPARCTAPSTVWSMKACSTRRAAAARTNRTRERSFVFPGSARACCPPTPRGWRIRWAPRAGCSDDSTARHQRRPLATPLGLRLASPCRSPFRIAALRLSQTISRSIRGRHDPDVPAAIPACRA